MTHLATLTSFLGPPEVISDRRIGEDATVTVSDVKVMLPSGSVEVNASPSNGDMTRHINAPLHRQGAFHVPTTPDNCADESGKNCDAEWVMC